MIASKAAIGLAAIITLVRVVSLLGSLVLFNIAAWQWDTSWFRLGLLALLVYVGSSYMMHRRMTAKR